MTMTNRFSSKTAFPIVILALALIVLTHLSAPHLTSLPLLPSDQSFSFPSLPSFGAAQSSESVPWSDPRLGSLHMSRFVAHSPGFSVIENLYWRNWTFYVVTDQPHLVPPLNLVNTAGYELDPTVMADGPSIGLMAIREDPLMPAIDENKQVGASISLEDATGLFGDAQVLEGVTLLTADDNFIAHYYHWVGEMFLGAWRLWCNLFWRHGLSTPDFDRIAFIKQWDSADAPDSHENEFIWNDPAGANEFFMDKFFPRAKIETRREWAERASSNQVYRLSRVLIADRKAGHNGPSAGYKPFGDILRMPVNSDYLLMLRDRVLGKYRGSVSLQPPKLLRVAYLSRQDTGRRLSNATHERLVEELKRLEREGSTEVQFLHFNKATTFEDQVALISTVDVLVGVHGNGLTHVLWMTPGHHRAVFELQPQGCHMNDYSPLATANGIQHFLVNGNSVCKPLECHIRGCSETLPELKTVNRPDIEVDVNLVTDEIRRIIAARGRRGAGWEV